MLQLAWPPFLYVLLLSLTVAFAVWTYRRTHALTRRQRLLLTLLRSTTLGLVLTLLADPLLVRTERRQTPPELALLIDDSASMPLAARDSSQQLAQRLQQTLPWDALQKTHLHSYGFGATLFPLPEKPRLLADSLWFRRTRTDLNQAILEVQQRHPHLRAIVLISDGQFNTGPSPLYSAERLGIPIFTVAVGDTARPRDIWIDRIETNTLAYTRTRLPVTAHLQARGFAGAEVTIRLEVDGREIERQRHTFSAQEERATVTFTYEPQQPGLHRLRVYVDPAAGEFLDSNNGESAVVRVLERRRRILLLGAAPEPDLANLQRLLAQNADLEVTTRVQRDDRRFYGGPLPDSLEAFDLIILAGYPGREASTTDLERIAAAAERVPLLFLLSPQTDLRRLSALAEVLPARPDQILPGYVDVAFQLRPEARTHAVFDLPGGIPDALEQLPPLRTTLSTWTVAPDARLLAVARSTDGASPTPLLVVQERGGHRRAALLGSGTWRWSSLPDAFDELRTFWETLLNNLMQWLTAPSENQQVRIRPERDTFGEDEPVRLLGEVYDERLAPVDDATVTVDVWDADSTRYPFRMESTGNGRYRLEIDNLPQGLYRYRGEARRGTELLGRDSGYFAVGATTLEYKTPWADWNLLRQLAGRTGGRFLTLSEASTLATTLQQAGLLTPSETLVQAEWRPRMTWPPLALIILLLTIEWVLRKRFGVV
ncbi:vWA domain-containing protein [Rhodothermus marinus]|uniref:VWA domain-containing protein n=1 Tax=Rhodothermus marinus (strain ATCC 43812 / DSM 4252 / R-10) TaxID=518766 RepID=D0MIC1_RHOM4|nr:vWA domain-containing protein [Rhodothermus marinus]ACY48229.1 hypothetical protein Rmar_1340 [Rhodothermus marinus DSM 4252]